MEVFKYEGAGDDAIFLDNRDRRYDSFLAVGQAKLLLLHRNFGVGGNTIHEIRSHPEADFELIYYNGAGEKAKVCGNGCRMAVAFAAEHFLTQKQGQEVKFMTYNGMLTGKYDVNTKSASVTMGDITQMKKLSSDSFLIDSGTPHVVFFVDSTSDIDLITEGSKLIEQHKEWPKYTCINFVEEKADGIHPRCFDSSHGEELLGCGTASVSSAVASVLRKEVPDNSSHSVNVHWTGGTIVITFTYKEGCITNIVQTGPANSVFVGKYKPKKHLNCI